VTKSVEDAFRLAQAEEASLTSALDEQKREALALNRRGIEYASLERDAESSRLMYQSLMQRAKETGVSRELRATNIRIVDDATLPKRPIVPRLWSNMIVGLVSGSMLALLAVFSAEALDDRLKTPEDMRAGLDLPFLGLVPEVRLKRHRKVTLREDGIPASFAEAVRAMRTSVVSSASDKVFKSILVASAGEGEGKTVVATNLAMALAQARQRVLLIDADMRCPTVHEMFGHRLEPGLSDVLTGTATIADVLRLTSVPNLTVVSAGTPSLQASELLGSTLFKELFDILEEHYTWVVIDSPPVLTVTDASVVAPRVGGVVFVVRSGTTRGRAARLAVEELRRPGGHVLGTVLNRADLKHHPFYFSPYLRGEYRQDVKVWTRRGRHRGTVLGRSA
jgi:capsular exopolysaccharide synthesis family protein